MFLRENEILAKTSKFTVTKSSKWLVCPLDIGQLGHHAIGMGESFQDYSRIQDFEADL